MTENRSRSSGKIKLFSHKSKAVRRPPDNRIQEPETKIHQRTPAPPRPMNSTSSSRAPYTVQTSAPTRTYDPSLPRVVRDPDMHRSAQPIPSTGRAYTRTPSRFANSSEHYEQALRRQKADLEKRMEKQRRFRKKYTAFSAVCVVAVAIIYTYIAFFSTGLIGRLRDLYVETAIMTFSHSWLATCMFPSSVVDETRDNISNFEKEQEGLVSDWTNVKETPKAIVIKGDGSKKPNADETVEPGSDPEPGTDTPQPPVVLEYWEDPDSYFYQLFDEIEPDTLISYIRANPDSFDENGLIFIDKADIGADPTGIMTRQGDPVTAIDERDGIMLACVTGGSFLSGDNYRGVIAFIKDPSAITLAASSRFGVVGQKIGKIAGDNGAILGINASGFADDNGSGNGGIVHGLVVCEGKTLSRAAGGTYFSIYFDSDDHLNISAYYKGLDIVNGVEFKPAIIVNGKNKIAKERFGIQPRTAIAQKADETVMMLVVDGRQGTYSLGTTVTELEVIFERYDALQAACLDGGSSSVMYFNGRLVTSSSSPQEGGRFLPDAFLVMPKPDEAER